MGPSIRAFAGQFINIYYAIGYMLLAPIAYLIRDWKMLQLTLTMTYAPFILLILSVVDCIRPLCLAPGAETVHASLVFMSRIMVFRTGNHLIVILP